MKSPKETAPKSTSKIRRAEPIIILVKITYLTFWIIIPQVNNNCAGLRRNIEIGIKCTMNFETNHFLEASTKEIGGA